MAATTSRRLTLAELARLGKTRSDAAFASVILIADRPVMTEAERSELRRLIALPESVAASTAQPSPAAATRPPPRPRRDLPKVVSERAVVLPRRLTEPDAGASRDALCSPAPAKPARKKALLNAKETAELLGVDVGTLRGMALERVRCPVAATATPAPMS